MVPSSDLGVFYVAFSPEREDPGRTDIERHDIPKVIGGVDPIASDLACTVYGSIFRSRRVLRGFFARARGSWPHRHRASRYSQSDRRRRSDRIRSGVYRLWFHLPISACFTWLFRPSARILAAPTSSVTIFPK